ncbi:MAG: twin-arginine translocase subunit TatB [Candidatus Aminicenantes bacterium]|nr:twin-arginine translocase subunit TatB [Candidatus Aminicenantes bacterium]
MFGSIGFPELVLVFVVVLLVFGPKKLPEFAKFLGKAVRQFRSTVDEAKATIQDEIYKEGMSELKDVGRDVKEALNIADDIGRDVRDTLDVGRHLKETIDVGGAVRRRVKDTLDIYGGLDDRGAADNGKKDEGKKS